MSSTDTESILTFLRDLIHELKDPFAAIHGSLQLLPLLSSLPQDEREYLVTSLQRNAQALKGVLEDASLFTKMASSEATAIRASRASTCDLAVVFESALEDLSPRLASREQIVPQRPKSGLTVVGEAELLRRCLACLLGSLSRASKHGAPLNCEVKTEGERISLELTSSGRICAEDYRIRLASMLARDLGAELQTVEFGWVLGLSKARTREGESLTDKAPTTKSSSPSEEVSRLRVLVVEDNPLARAALASMLRGAGAIVQDVGNAEEAFEIMIQTPPDLILCDLGLPGDSDGLDLARQVRREPRLAHTRLIAVTGQAASKEQQSYQAGFDLVVEKPLHDAALRQLLEQTRAAGQ